MGIGLDWIGENETKGDDEKEKREKAERPKLICSLAAMTKEGKESSLEITAKY